MNGCDRYKGRGIDRVQNGVDAFEKSTHTRGAIFLGHGCRSRIEFAQVPAGGENRLARTGNNADRSLRRKHIKRGNKFFQLREHGRANFVGGLMIDGQFDHAFAPLPAQRFTGEIFHFHSCCLLGASRTAFESYMALTSEAYRALMASRRSLPLTVSNPLSGENPSRTMVKFRICR